MKLDPSPAETSGIVILKQEDEEAIRLELAEKSRAEENSRQKCGEHGKGHSLAHRHKRTEKGNLRAGGGRNSPDGGGRGLPS